MKVYEARVRVVRVETWSVEAIDEAEARRKFVDFTADVQDDETGGEIVDWEIESVKQGVVA